MLDVQNQPVAEAAAVIDHLEKNHCDHEETLLRTMTIEEMCDEWWVLRRGEQHDQYEPTDECPDPGECRAKRQWDIERELSTRAASTVGEALAKFALMERTDYDRTHGQVPAIVERFEMDEYDNCNKVEVAFNHGAARDLFVSIVRDLHYLTRGRES